MIISFPGTAAIKKNGTSPQNYRDANRPLYIARKTESSDRLEISGEAKIKFHQERLVSIEKVRLMNEAGDIFHELDDELKFNEADLRNVYRLDRIFEVKDLLEESFYDENEDEILKKMIDDSL